MTVYHSVKEYGYCLAELSYSLLQSNSMKDITNDVVNNGVTDIPTIKVKSVIITKDNLKKKLIDTNIFSLNDIQ